MYSVVLDTNVLISALLFPGGAPSRVYELAKRGAVRLHLSGFILWEVERVLVVKFQLDAAVAAAHLRRLKLISKTVTPRKRAHCIKTRDDDNRILECALEARADFLITGDKKHILPLQTIGECVILSPAQFMMLYQN